MRYLISGLIALVLLSASCGGEETVSDETASSAPLDTLILYAADTLGSEFGETPDVFAFIIDAACTPEGGTAVLDAGRPALRVFRDDGTPGFTAGRQGSGPGEYQMPMGLAVTDYGYVLSDIPGGKIIRYDHAGDLIDEITGFFPVPPVQITGAGDRFLATDVFMDVQEGELPRVSLDYVAFTSSTEPETVFYSFPMDVSGGDVNTGNNPDFSFSAGPGGEAYLAVVSDSVIHVTGYDREGEKLLEIHEDFERIPLTEEELAEERLALSLTVSDGETSIQRDRVPVTEGFREIVSGIGTDADGQLWVEMGDTGEQYFRIYSSSGEPVAVVIPDETIGRDAQFSITPNGMLAWDADPEDWPKVYLLELR